MVVNLAMVYISHKSVRKAPNEEYNNAEDAITKLAESRKTSGEDEQLGKQQYIPKQCLEKSEMRSP